LIITFEERPLIKSHWLQCLLLVVRKKFWVLRNSISGRTTVIKTLRSVRPYRRSIVFNSGERLQPQNKNINEIRIGIGIASTKFSASCLPYLITISILE